MATAPKMFPGSAPSPGQDRGKAQLRKDRMIGLAALLVIAALMALLIWLASLGGAPTGIDSFPLMP